MMRLTGIVRESMPVALQPAFPGERPGFSGTELAMILNNH